MMANHKGRQITVVMILFLSIAWLTLLLRLYVRVWLKKCFGADDIMVVMSAMVFSAMCGFLAASVSYGFGKHMDELEPIDIQNTTKWFYFTELSYTFSTALVKVAISITLLRIALVRTHIWILRGVIVFSFILSTFYFFWVMFQCWPVAYFWEQITKPGSGRCNPSTFMAYATYTHISLIAVIDMTLAIVPIFIVRTLNLNRSTKISLAFVLAIGSVASVATIARIPYIHYLKASDDLFYDTADLAIWTVVEIGICVTAASAAMLKPLLIKLGIFGSSGGASNDRPFGREIYQRKGSKNYWPGRTDAPLEQRRGGDKDGEESVIASLDRTGSTELITWDYHRKLSKTTIEARVPDGSSDDLSPSMEGGIERRVDVEIRRVG